MKIFLFLLSAINFSNALANDCASSLMICVNNDGSFSSNRNAQVSYQRPVEVKQKRNPVTQNSGKALDKSTRSLEAKNYIAQCLPNEYHAIMQKIVAHESGANQFAIGVNGNYGRYKQPQRKEEAIDMAKQLMSQGRSFDMGFAQINSQHLKPEGFLTKLGISISDIFEPCVNLRAGANIYGNAAIKNGGDVKVALSIYNTGTKSNGITNGYVNKVLGSNL